jgi:Zn-dependent peptidase ImmA (M78 family)
MDRRSEIEDLASFVADSYFPDDKIDPYILAENNGITYSFGDYSDCFDGLLEWQRGRFHIYGNANRIRDKAYPRARFTFGHELGHFYIDEHRQAMEQGAASVACLTDFQSENAAEREADFFASHLLMPTERFVSAAKGAGAGVVALRKLTEMFGASLSSTAIRYAQSDVSPVIAMLWTASTRKWCWSSTQFSELTNNWAFKDPSRLPRDSATVRLLEEPLSTPGARGTTLSTWFPRVRQGGRDDRIMVEDVLPLGNYGVITVLYPAE